MVYTLSEGEVNAPRSIGALLRFTYKESVAHIRDVTHDFLYPKGDIDDSPATAIAMGSLLMGGFLAEPFLTLGKGIYEWYKAAKFDRKLERWLKERKPPRDFKPELGLEGNLES